MFTIEVKKREQNESFTFCNLQLFHQECLGGEIEVVLDGRESCTLICQRRKSRREVENEKEVIEIIKTAIDGQEREMKLNKNLWWNISDNNAKVIQTN